MFQVYLVYFLVLFITQTISVVATNGFILLLTANNNFFPLLLYLLSRPHTFLKMLMHSCTMGNSFNIINCLV